MQAGIKQIVLVGIGFLSLNAIAMDPGEELQKAAHEGDPAVVDQLLSSGVDPDGSTVFSPLFGALLEEKYDIVEKLINAGATIDQDIFGLAAELGRIDILELGLQNPDVDINALDTVNQQTAFKIAKLYEQEEVQAFLLEHGATA